MCVYFEGDKCSTCVYYLKKSKQRQKNRLHCETTENQLSLYPKNPQSFTLCCHFMAHRRMKTNTVSHLYSHLSLFHLCRYNYMTEKRQQENIQEFKAAGVQHFITMRLSMLQFSHISTGLLIAAVTLHSRPCIIFPVRSGIYEVNDIMIYIFVF